MVDMEGALLLIVFAIGLAIFDIAADRWGVDSRDGSKDPRRPTLLPLR
jgi:hypothetical protein